MLKFDVVIYVVFPYVAITIATLGCIYRLVQLPFTANARSSQILESGRLFWGVILFHFAVLGTVGTHFGGLFTPRAISHFLISNPLIHGAMIVIGITIGLSMLAGLFILLRRRQIVAEIRATTRISDWIVLVALIAQIALGTATIVVYRHGSEYFIDHANPWLWSLIRFQPETESLQNVPWFVKLHFVNAFVLALLLPFTRLIHIILFPVAYLWRQFIVFRWNRRAPSLPSSSD